MEKYDGSVRIEFDDIPLIQLVSIKSDSDAGLLERLSLATQRRRFVLRESWQVNIHGIDHHERLNGTIEIPHKDMRGEKIRFDGASIPVPWLVSLLTLGILRPLGVMLIASIIHDYIYRFGYLRVASDGMRFESVDVSRDKADKLFRDIVGTVNGMPVVGYIGWYFIRLGWPFIRFNNKRFGGRAPVKEYIVLLLILAFVYLLLTYFKASVLLSGLVTVYLVFYVLTIVLNLYQRRRRH